MSTPTEQTAQASPDAMVEVRRGEEEEASLLPLPPLTAYHGQFDYIVPSEGIENLDSGIAEVHFIYARMDRILLIYERVVPDAIHSLSPCMTHL